MIRKSYVPWKDVADKVISYADRMAALDDEELRDLTESYKERYKKGESLDDLLA